jgi:hypothetical protein
MREEVAGFLVQNTRTVVRANAGTTCGESVPYLAGRTGAEICSVRSRSDMSTTVTIGAVSS